ncbi:MAG: phosphorylase [Desulfuromonadales bacterium]|nr:phosphorylase [Desulfuromonadales bacterium]
MKIVIITAMPEESRAIMRRARLRETSLLSGRKRYRIQISGHEIVLVEAGMGMLNAGWAASALATESPDLMISAGFGGAVLPGLVVGDVVMAERILHLSGAELEEVAVGFYGRNAAADSLSFRRGVCISCDQILNKGDLALRLPAGVVNPVVEMESAAVARIAASHSIPFLALRAISDPWDEELDFSIDEFCDEDMRIRPAKVLATILRRPAIIPQVIRLARNSHVAASGLARAMERLLGHI